jgi:hypothetical protein
MTIAKASHEDTKVTKFSNPKTLRVLRAFVAKVFL